MTSIFGNDFQVLVGVCVCAQSLSWEEDQSSSGGGREGGQGR